MGKFSGKVVIVSGASAGIGAATAVAFAKEGAKIVINGRENDRLQVTAKLCRESGAEKVLEIASDLKEFDNLQGLINRAVEEFSAIDIVVNSAASRPLGEVAGLTLDEYESTMNLNLRAPVFLCKYALPYLKKTKGCVVNVSACLSFRAMPGAVVYCMTKSAMDHFTRGLAAECASDGVRVNSILPGLVDTGMTNPQRMPNGGRECDKQFWKWAVGAQPLGVMQPDVIADSVLFLCESTHTTGTTFLVDGGILLPN